MRSRFSTVFKTDGGESHMTNKLRTMWVLAACVFTWAATSGVAITFAGSPSKKPLSVSINDLTHSADEAANSGDYFTALRLYRQLAERGDARAQTTVGIMIADSDLKEAVKWFEIAAAQAYAEAEFRLGRMFEEGNGVPKDREEAVKWYKLAAAHGYLEAEYILGTKERPVRKTTNQQRRPVDGSASEREQNRQLEIQNLQERLQREREEQQKKFEYEQKNG
jgi:hypothetical protein